MSNKLINLAQQLRQIVPLGPRGLALPARDIFPSEMAVLMALANDAREIDGDVSKLRTVKIMARTRLSEPAVRKAYRQLQANGHITRLRGAEGEQSTTIVHPKLTPFSTTAADTWVSSVQVTPISNTGNPCIQDMGPIEYIDRTIDHSPHGRAGEGSNNGFRPAQPGPVHEPVSPPVERPLEPVDQVFAAWDAWRDRAGLPGPVRQDAARRVAVDRAIRENGLGKVLMMVDKIEHEVRAGNLRRKNHEGQDSIWATFDAAFEIGHAANLRLLTRMLDGDFGALVPREVTAPAVKECLTVRSDEPEPSRRLRAALLDRLGAKACAVWIDALRFEWGGDGLVVLAPSDFHAEWVRDHFGGQLRSVAGGDVLVIASSLAGTGIPA